MHEDGERPALALVNPFWRFSLAVYAADGVKEECLLAQDAFGADVNVLLYCAWLGAAHAIPLDGNAVAEIAGTVERWSRMAVAPLRAARRAIKAMPEVQHAEVQALRQSIAAMELEAEQIEQALLFALPRQRKGSGPSPLVADVVADLVAGNVAAYLGHLGYGAAALPQLVRAAVARGRELDLGSGPT